MKRNCHLYGLILAPKHQRHSGPLIRIRIRSTFFIPKEILFVARLQSTEWKWPRWNNHCMVPLDRLTPDLLHRSWWPRESHQSQLPPAAAPDPLISATGLEHVSDVTAAKVKHQNSAKSGLPATTLWHHILLTSRREKLHVHRRLLQWSVRTHFKLTSILSVRWSSRTFQEARGYIIVFITIIVIFHFIFAQKKQTNNTFQGADRAPANPQTNHYSYSLLKTQLKSM